MLLEVCPLLLSVRQPNRKWLRFPRPKKSLLNRSVYTNCSGDRTNWHRLFMPQRDVFLSKSGRDDALSDVHYNFIIVLN